MRPVVLAGREPVGAAGGAARRIGTCAWLTTARQLAVEPEVGAAGAKVAAAAKICTMQ